MRITELKTTKRGRIALFADGEFIASCDAETAAKNGVRAGSELTEQELARLLDDSNLRMAKEKALRILALRDHGQAELAQKLKRNYGADAAENAAARMAELGLVDDEAYAGKLARELTERKGFSAARARLEMTRRGLDRETAEHALEALAPDEDDRALALLQKKYPRGLNDEKDLRRAFNLLARYGYRGEEIRRALKEYGAQEDGGEL